MILLVGPAAGFLVGLLVTRLSVVFAVVVIAVLLSAIGLPLGWFDTEDMEPLGGLIITVLYFEIPTLVFFALGACARRSLATRQRSMSR